MFRFAQHDKDSWRAPRFAGHLKRQRLENIPQAVIHDDLLLQTRQDRLHRLKIKSSARHFRGFAILGE
jgi:hypothetical protein